jgi:hypothetical protein
VYRHAHAFGLFEKRKRIVRAALERIIEKAGEVEVTASAVVGALQAYAKINANGQWVDQSTRRADAEFQVRGRDPRMVYPNRRSNSGRQSGE